MRLLTALIALGIVAGGSCANDPPPPPRPGLDSASQVFAVYLGGSGYDSIRDLTADAEGNVYVTGGTTSTDFPETAGAHGQRPAGKPETAEVELFDVFVMKLDPAGQVVWSTVIGGPNYDRAYAIEVDERGSVYVGGRAGAGFPVTPGAAQTAFMGGREAPFYGNQDGFVMKLAPDGSRIEWATYFGAGDPQIVRDLAVDRAGNVYIASGHSAGGRYPPGVAETFVNEPKGAQDAVIAKLRPDGGKVLWSRYAGGADDDFGNGSVRLNADGVPHLLFTTRSSGIATAGAADTTYGGDEDMSISRVDPDTGAEVWTTYLGGSANESTETHEFAGIDAAGQVYVSGPTKSRDFPTTAGTFSQTFSSGEADSNDVFVAKISSDGRTLVAATYVGGRGFDRTEGAAVDADGNVFLTGVTSSRDFPVTAEAVQGVRAGGERDMFVLKLTPDLRLAYASFAGGGGFDGGRAAAVDSRGDFYIGGETNSGDWPGARVDARARRNSAAVVARYHFTPTSRAPR